MNQDWELVIPACDYVNQNIPSFSDWGVVRRFEAECVKNYNVKLAFARKGRASTPAFCKKREMAVIPIDRSLCLLQMWPKPWMKQ